MGRLGERDAHTQKKNHFNKYYDTYPFYHSNNYGSNDDIILLEVKAVYV